WAIVAAATNEIRKPVLRRSFRQDDRIFMILQDGVLDLFEGAMKNVVLTRDAEPHAVVILAAIGKRAARHAGHAFADQHLVEIDRVTKARRNLGPDVECGT